MALIEYPAGMSLCTVTLTLGSVKRPRAGRYRVECFRKFGYIGTDWVMDRYSEWFRLIDGRMELELPHSDQPGLLGDNGAPLASTGGYKIVVRPTASEPIETAGWELLPMSVGPTLALPPKASLGGWPNQTVVVNPPPVTGGSAPTYVQAPGMPPGYYVLAGSTA